MPQRSTVLQPRADRLRTLKHAPRLAGVEIHQRYRILNSSKKIEFYEPDFSENTISEILSHPTRKTHWMMNEISRKFPEFARSVKKGLGGEGASHAGRTTDF